MWVLVFVSTSKTYIHDSLHFVILLDKPRSSTTSFNSSWAIHMTTLLSTIEIKHFVKKLSWGMPQNQNIKTSLSTTSNIHPQRFDYRTNKATTLPELINFCKLVISEMCLFALSKVMIINIDAPGFLLRPDAIITPC